VDITLSFSRVSTYLECPYKFFLAYIVGLPGIPRSYFSFGKSVHAALEEFHRPKLLPSDSDVEYLLSLYEKYWISEGFPDVETELRTKDEGRSILIGYHNNLAGNLPRVAEVEMNFRLKLGDIDITGYIDRIDQNEDGSVSLVDYKTSKSIPSTLEDLDRLQLSIYSLAISTLWNVKVRQASNLYLRQMVWRGFEPTLADIDMANETIQKVAKNIGEKQFDRCPNRYCQYCDFYQGCQGTNNVIHIEESF
jgi:RecB family exonuclease